VEYRQLVKLILYIEFAVYRSLFDMIIYCSSLYCLCIVQ